MIRNQVLYFCKSTLQGPLSLSLSLSLSILIIPSWQPLIAQWFLPELSAPTVYSWGQESSVRSEWCLGSANGPWESIVFDRPSLVVGPHAPFSKYFSFTFKQYHSDKTANWESSERKRKFNPSGTGRRSCSRCAIILKIVIRGKGMLPSFSWCSHPDLLCLCLPFQSPLPLFPRIIYSHSLMEGMRWFISFQKSKHLISWPQYSRPSKEMGWPCCNHAPHDGFIFHLTP